MATRTTPSMVGVRPVVPGDAVVVPHPGLGAAAGSAGIVVTVVAPVDVVEVVEAWGAVDEGLGEVVEVVEPDDELLQAASSRGTTTPTSTRVERRRAGLFSPALSDPSCRTSTPPFGNPGQCRTVPDDLL